MYTGCIFIVMDSGDLKERRTRLELSQDGLAKVLGVSTNTVARWERGEVPMPNYLELALKQLETDLKKKKP